MKLHNDCGKITNMTAIKVTFTLLELKRSTDIAVQSTDAEYACLNVLEQICWVSKVYVKIGNETNKTSLNICHSSIQQGISNSDITF